MKTTHKLFLFATVTAIIACKKAPQDVTLTSNTTEIYSEGGVTFNLKANNAYFYEWDFGNGKTGNYGDGEVWMTYDKPGVYDVKVTAFSKNKKKEAESNIISIKVNKWNTKMLGNYNVKDTTWSYATNAIKYGNYTVTIEDGGDVNGKTVYVKNFGNLFPTEKVKCDLYQVANGNGVMQLVNYNTNPPLLTPNIFYYINMVFDYSGKYKSWGDIKDQTIIYSQGTTAPYFSGTSYWTKQ